MAYFQSRRRREYPGDVLRPNAFDRASSLLVALLTLAGVIVLVLFGLWAAPHKTDEWVMTYQPKLVDAVPAEEEPSEFETPSPDELPGIPLIQSPELFAASMAQAMDSITAQAAGELKTVETLEAERRLTESSDSAAAEPIPRWKRWEILFATASADEYSAQLDHFGIELAVAGSGQKTNVDYASSFAAESPTAREAPGADETRLYQHARDESLQEFNRELMQRAGIPIDGRLLLQFYPAATEELLAQAEARHAGDRPVEQIQKTIFGVRPAAGGYEFFVESQRYR